MAQRYFCHNCETTVKDATLIVDTGEYACLLCNETFVEVIDENDEEMEEVQQESAEQPQPFGGASPFSFSLYINDGNQMHSAPQQFRELLEPIHNTLANFYSNSNPSNPQQSPNSQPQPGQNPMMIQTIGQVGVFDLRNARQAGQANQVLNSFLGNFMNANLNFANGGNLGDYAWGPMSQIISQLQDPNRHGPPPVAKDVYENLPSKVVTEKMILNDDCVTECAVCKESFAPLEKVRELPCGHLFHSECILPWLQMRNTCPVCRFEMKTDNEWYENLRQARDQQRELRRTQANPAPMATNQTTSIPENLEERLDDLGLD